MQRQQQRREATKQILVCSRMISTTPRIEDIQKLLDTAEPQCVSAKPGLSSTSNHMSGLVKAFLYNGVCPPKQDFESQLQGNTPVSPRKLQLMRRMVFAYSAPLFRAFLPAGFPHSFAQEGRPFLRYSICSLLANILGAAGSVIATQAMLLSLGLTAIQAAPAAAAFNWIIKDLLGQIGGAFISSRSGQLFDLLPGYHRLKATKLILFASAIEMITPQFPGLFVVIGAIANMLKNISWLALGATKASANVSFSNGGNLGDITAKNGLQATVAGVLGTTLGAWITYIQAGQDLDISTNVTQSIVIFSMLGFSSYIFTKQAMKEVISRQQSPLVLAAIQKHKDTPLTPALHAKEHDISEPYVDPLWNQVEIHINDPVLAESTEYSLFANIIDQHGLPKVHASLKYFEAKPYFALITHAEEPSTPTNTFKNKYNAYFHLSCPRQNYLPSLSGSALQPEVITASQKIHEFVAGSRKKTIIHVYMKKEYKYSDVIEANIYSILLRDNLLAQPTSTDEELLQLTTMQTENRITEILETVKTHWNQTQSHLLLQKNGYLAFPWEEQAEQDKPNK